MKEEQPVPDGGVTVVVSREIKAGREAECEVWLKGITQAAMTFEGHLGVQVIRPGDHDHPEYVTIFRFDRYDNLREWNKSQLRAIWLKRAAEFTKQSNMQVLTGLEYWFTLPGRQAASPPPRYKMAVVTWLAITPLVIGLAPVYGLVFGWLPWLIPSMIGSAMTVILMTWVVMPRMTRLFSFWLFANS